MTELGKPPPIMQPPPILKGACRLETLPAGSLFVIHNPEKPFTLTFTLAAAADVVINPARVQAVARYGVGVPHGEAFALTDEQIAEWRAAEAIEIASQISERLDATAKTDRKRFFDRWDDIIENGLGGKGGT